MEKHEIKATIESLLFLNGEPLSLKELSEGVGAPVYVIEEAVNELREEYTQKDGGIVLLALEGRVQMCTNPKNETIIARYFQPVKKASLSTSALETLSIVAYKQPITRLEIEQIRQVQCSYILKFLQSHGLVEAVGRKKTLGHPSLYGTTDAFLRMLGISCLQELPKIDQLQEYENAVRE